MASANEEMVLREFLRLAAELREAVGSSGVMGVAAEDPAPVERAAEPPAPATEKAANKPTPAAEQSAPAEKAAPEARTFATQALEGFARIIESSPVYQAAQEEDDGGGVASKVLRSGLGMAPLARLIVGLFTGGDEEEPPPLVKYALPPAMRFETADGPGASLLGADYGQDGLPRAYATERTATPPETVPQAAPQVTIQVQAMDSRSFLDHKEEIARAVREAMLNSHSLNDVVNDL